MTDRARPQASPQSTGGAQRQLDGLLDELSSLVPEAIVQQVGQAFSQIAPESPSAIAKALFELDSDSESRQMLCEAMDRLGLWFPVYDFNRSIAENADPWGVPSGSPHTLDHRAWSVLGHKVGVPIGIPASPLTLNSEWIKHHANSGYNVLTFKTRRPRARAAHEFPNWVFLHDEMDPISPGVATALEYTAEAGTWPARVDRATAVNSLGVPSSEPEDWIADVKRGLLPFFKPTPNSKRDGRVRDPTGP